MADLPDLTEMFNKAERGEFVYCENPYCPGYVLEHSLCSDNRARAETKRRKAAEMDEATRAAFVEAAHDYYGVYASEQEPQVEAAIRAMFLAGVEHGRATPLKVTAEFVSEGYIAEVMERARKLTETEATLAKLLAAVEPFVVEDGGLGHPIPTSPEFEALAAAVAEIGGDDGIG